PFVIPGPILAAWRAAGKRGRGRRKAWFAALEQLPAAEREGFERRVRGDLPANFGEVAISLKRKLAEDKAPIATRKASQATLEILAKDLPEHATGSSYQTPPKTT